VVLAVDAVVYAVSAVVFAVPAAVAAVVNVPTRASYVVLSPSARFLIANCAVSSAV